jgi:hypothetical protein
VRAVLRAGIGLLAVLAACRRPPAAVTADATADADAEVAPDVPAAPRCTVLDTRWIVAGATSDDAGAEAGYESIEVAGGRALLTDTRTGRLRLVRAGDPHEATLTLEGEHSDPRLLPLGRTPDADPVVAWVAQRMAGRQHFVRVGARLDRGCEQPEGRDEGLSLAAASTARGALLAWDEEGPAPAAGHILVQAVGPEALRPVSPRGVAGACPAPRQISPPEQDASDPVAVGLGDGAAVFWLTSRDVEGGEEHNETVTDLWGVAVNAAGVVRGTPLRLTRGPGHRFGLALASSDASTVWVAWRSAPESDAESRGDGGEVALARVSASGAGLVRVDRTAVVSAPGDVPTGAPTVWAQGGQVSVWWRARRDGRVVTLRRPVDGSGQPDAEGPMEEPMAEGRLPLGAAGDGAVALLRTTSGGGVGIARLRCP